MAYRDTGLSLTQKIKVLAAFRKAGEDKEKQSKVATDAGVSVSSLKYWDKVEKAEGRIPGKPGLATASK